MALFKHYSFPLWESEHPAIPFSMPVHAWLQLTLLYEVGRYGTNNATPSVQEFNMSISYTYVNICRIYLSTCACGFISIYLHVCVPLYYINPIAICFGVFLPCCFFKTKYISTTLIRQKINTFFFFKRVQTWHNFFQNNKLVD